MAKLSTFLNLAEKIIFSIWGITFLDLFAVFNFDLLKEVDSTIRTIFTLLGAIYFVMQLVYKFLSLKSQRRHDTNVEKLQLQDLEMKRIKREYFELRRDYHTIKDTLEDVD